MTHHKSILLLFLAGSLVLSISAQNKPKETAQPVTYRSQFFPVSPLSDWSVGVWGGMTQNEHVINTAYATDMKYTPANGDAYGVDVRYNLKGWLSFSAEPSLVQKNYRMDRDGRGISFLYTDYVNNYLSIPLSVQISIGSAVRLYGIGGAYVGYWLSGHRSGQSLSVTYLLNGDEESTFFDQPYEFSSERDNRFDAGLLYGAGLRATISKKYELFVEYRTCYGLTDVQKAYMEQLNPRYNTTTILLFGASYCL